LHQPHGDRRTTPAHRFARSLPIRSHRTRGAAIIEPSASNLGGREAASCSRPVHGSGMRTTAPKTQRVRM
jgi:hypothetical protein